MQFVVNRARGWLRVDFVELDEKHRSDLFSTIALEKDLPGRYSRLLMTMDFLFTAAESV